MVTQNKVAVIGAGISGLGCATALQKAGLKVTLFEKSRGASGRLSTRLNAQLQCDHGAQYFTARDPLFAAEVQRWIDAGVAQLWQPALQVFDGKVFTPKHHGDDPATLRYVGYPSNNAPAKWLASTLDVQYESTVSSIYKHAGFWQISTQEQGLYPERFDTVILCIPAPQAAALLYQASPRLAEQCASVVMQPCFALMVQFEKTVGCTFDGLFINSGILSWIARDSSKPGRPQGLNASAETWVLHADSKWSRAHVDADKAKVAQQMLAEFRSILASYSASTASQTVTPATTNEVLHRWLYADCEEYLSSVSIYDAAHGIGLCGDWLNGGKVQGAWLSGIKLASRLVDGD